MHRCVVCGNSSRRTKHDRPEVIYHGFPKNEYARRQWLKVFGIDRCQDWQRVCSDHFLKENYRPGKKNLLYAHTIPQPYEKKCNRNDFSLNTATQRNDVENVKNELLTMENNLLRDEHIENAVVNNIKLPRRSSRRIKLPTTCENISFKTYRLERQNPKCIASDNIETVIKAGVPVFKNTPMVKSLISN